MGMLLLAVALTASLLQASSNGLRAIGVPWTSADVRQVRQLTSGQIGGQPWLLVGATGQITNHWSATAYGPVNRTGAGIRWGMAVELSGPASDEKAPRVWSIWRSWPYAQVALEGRGFEDVRSESDGNIPFAVRAEFSDDELVEIVRFVRSSPAGPAGRPTGIDVARHPITAIGRFRRAADTGVHQGVVVSFRTGNLSGGWFELERNGSGWFVAQTGGWIA